MKWPNDEQLKQILYDICDREHSSCNDACPVYHKNGHSPVNPHKPFKENRECDCFKDSGAMLKFMRDEQ